MGGGLSPVCPSPGSELRSSWSGEALGTRAAPLGLPRAGRRVWSLCADVRGPFSPTEILHPGNGCRL